MLSKVGWNTFYVAYVYRFGTTLERLLSSPNFRRRFYCFFFVLLTGKKSNKKITFTFEIYAS